MVGFTDPALVAWGYNSPIPLAGDLQRAESTLAARHPRLCAVMAITYLRELAAKGIPTVETVEVNTLEAGSLRGAAAKLGASDLVIKPPISGGAHGTYRIGLDDPIPADVAGRRMMVQAFQPTIAAGEWSIIQFGGKFSHAVLKTPAEGDFRAPALGGTDRIAVPSRTSSGRRRCA